MGECLTSTPRRLPWVRAQGVHHARSGSNTEHTKGYRQSALRDLPGFKAGCASLYLIRTEKRHGRRGMVPGTVDAVSS